MIRSSFTIQKVRYGSNGPSWGLKTSDFLVPFPYQKPTDLRVSFQAEGNSRLLALNTDYLLDGSVLRLNEEALGLSQSSPLDVHLFITRVTELQDIKFEPGHPIKASDLNDLFEMYKFRDEELETLVKSNAHFGPTPPPSPWVGQLYVNDSYFRIYSWTGSEWVDVR